MHDRFHFETRLVLIQYDTVHGNHNYDIYDNIYYINICNNDKYRTQNTYSSTSATAVLLYEHVHPSLYIIQ